MTNWTGAQSARMTPSPPVLSRGTGIVCFPVCDPTQSAQTDALPDSPPVPAHRSRVESLG